MATYLDRILEHHRERAAADSRSFERLFDEATARTVDDPPRGFTDALRDPTTLSVIAEVKRRSPSKGDLAIDLDPAQLARSYQSAGAGAVSVLTDVDHFAGSAQDLIAARAAVSLPVIRKDFTVAAKDVLDARIMGADAVLLIAAALDDAELSDFDTLAAEVGLDALVEVHDEAELERALGCTRATLIGVNQRDLVTFEVDQNRAVRVAQRIPGTATKVAESGVRGPHDARALADAGYDAVLVGEHLVTGAGASGEATSGEGTSGEGTSGEGTSGEIGKRLAELRVARR